MSQAEVGNLRNTVWQNAVWTPFAKIPKNLGRVFWGGGGETLET